MKFTRHGLWEMIFGTLGMAIVAVGLAWVYPLLAIVVLPFWIWLLAFFRDPERPIPTGAGVYVSPADGLVSDVTTIENDPIIGGPAVRIGIFLSVFNVHVNRAPCAGKVTAVTYKVGKFLNALNHTGASNDNESNTIVIADADGQPVAVVKQIVGLIARRIVCTAVVGTTLTRGQRFGMIKFGSRTELTIPASLNPQVQVKVGQKVRGALDIIALISSPGTPGDG